VTTLCPGSVATEFQARAGLKPGFEHEILNVSASDVAQEGYRGLMANKRAVLPGLGISSFRFCSGCFRAGLSWRRSVAFSCESLKQSCWRGSGRRERLQSCSSAVLRRSASGLAYSTSSWPVRGRGQTARKKTVAFLMAVQHRGTKWTPETFFLRFSRSGCR